MNPLIIFSIYAFIWGALWGSFLNVVVHRLPRGMSLVTPRSHCPTCKKQISWYENVPIFSYLLLRGRCRHCQASISVRYLLVELVTAALSLLFFLKCADGRLMEVGLGPVLIPFLLYFLFICAVVAVALIDLEWTVIPDIITIPTALLGVVSALVMPRSPAFWDFHPAPTWQESVIGLLAGVGLIVLIYLGYRAVTGRMGIGGGDATMLGMIGGFLGWQAIVFVLFFASIQGLMAAVVAGVMERIRGEESSLFRRGVDRPEYWKEHPLIADKHPAEVDSASGKQEPELDGSDRKPGREEEGEQGSGGDFSELSTTGSKTGVPFGPFLALAALEYLFLGRLFELWMMGQV